MATDEFELEILKIFGYTPDDVGCSNVCLALEVIFEEDTFSDPMTLIQSFIHNCDYETFKNLKCNFN